RFDGLASQWPGVFRVPAQHSF
ncbi:hypothetical protein D046_5052C, partial [Vibrio parahaemolyticus V-223/04]